jgi:hypothetical protein
METDKYIKTFINHQMMFGRMVSGSKSGYMKRFPNNRVYFNANILTEEDGKIWYGDVDIDVDENVLNNIAKEIGKKIYVLYEMDYRFEHENLDPKIAIRKAVWKSK